MSEARATAGQRAAKARSVAAQSPRLAGTPATRGVGERATTPHDKGDLRAAPIKTPAADGAPAKSVAARPTKAPPSPPVPGMQLPRDQALYDFAAKLADLLVYKWKSKDFDPGDRALAGQLHSKLILAPINLSVKTFQMVMKNLALRTPEAPVRMFMLAREDPDIGRFLTEHGVPAQDIVKTWELGVDDRAEFVLGLLLGAVAEAGLASATNYLIGVAIGLILGALVAILSPVVAAVIAGAVVVMSDANSVKEKARAVGSIFDHVSTFVADAAWNLHQDPLGESKHLARQVLDAGADYGDARAAYDRAMVSKDLRGAGLIAGGLMVRIALMLMPLRDLKKLTSVAVPRLRALSREVALKAGLLRLLLRVDVAAIEALELEGVTFLKLPNNRLLVRAAGSEPWGVEKDQLRQWVRESAKGQPPVLPTDPSTKLASARGTARPPYEWSPTPSPERAATNPFVLQIIVPRQTVFIDTTIIDAIVTGKAGVENMLRDARKAGVRFAIPRPVITEALRGKKGPAARIVLDQLNLPIDEGRGIANRAELFDKAVKKKMQFEGLWGEEDRPPKKLPNDLSIAAHTVNSDALLWTLDRRSMTPGSQLGVRYWPEYYDIEQVYRGSVLQP